MDTNNEATDITYNKPTSDSPSSENFLPTLLHDSKCCCDEIINRFNINNHEIINNCEKVLRDLLDSTKNYICSQYMYELKNYIEWVYDHSINVSILSLMIANILGVDTQYCKDIALGALMHDIGKLSIPKEILLKPEKLNDSEMKVVRNHSYAGYCTVKVLNVSQRSLDIILHHHERIGGSGYPYGLKNDEITLGVRIVMVADALDAMTSLRPYQAKKNPSDAIQELNRCNNDYSDTILNVFASLIY